MENKVEVTLAHDYLLLKAPNYIKNNEEAAMIQIPIQEARILLEELLKDDYLKEAHTSRYPCSGTTEYVISARGWCKSKKL